MSDNKATIFLKIELINNDFPEHPIIIKLPTILYNEPEIDVVSKFDRMIKKSKFDMYFFLYTTTGFYVLGRNVSRFICYSQVPVNEIKEKFDEIIKPTEMVIINDIAE